jgi:hypothetical protein
MSCLVFFVFPLLTFLKEVKMFNNDSNKNQTPNTTFGSNSKPPFAKQSTSFSGVFAHPVNPFATENRQSSVFGQRAFSVPFFH